MRAGTGALRVGTGALRVGIDARLLAYRGGGIASYTRSLLTALVPLLQPAERLVVLQHARQRAPLLTAPATQRVTLITPPHHRYEQQTLPRELARARLDVLHCPDFIAPRHYPRPVVVTIHDLAFLHYPEILDDAACRYYAQIATTVRQAAAIIAVSHATRADITALLGVPPERVDVIHSAADPAFYPLAVAPGTQRVINGHRLTASAFALFVSTLEPRKNLPTLLRALRVVRDRDPATPYHLVVAGARGWRDQAIFATLRDERLYDAVTLLGGVAQPDLHWLYSACRLYLNPSRYEGFGLPVLEAMACAAPVVVAATSSLPEVAGDAAVVVPPLDVVAWADTLHQLWHAPDHRAELAQRGVARAAQFAWERTAAATLAVYRRCAAGSP